MQTSLASSERNSTQPRLSIVIPTWNRCEFLSENLRTIITEVQQFPNGEIEIFVSDNHSTDGTSALLQQLSAQYSFLRFIAQPQNRGANFNFHTVLQEGRGEYLWLLGDDDAIAPGCMAKILADIEAFKHPSIMIGGTESDKTHARIYLPNLHSHWLTNQTILCQYNAIHLAGKMSVLIFSKEILQKILDPSWQFIESTRTPWPHLVWFLQALALGETLLILPYSTNYIVHKNRCNLLQDGVLRVELVFVDYAALVTSLAAKFPAKIQNCLIKRITSGQIGELFKMVAYSTYFNSYGKTIRGAWHALWKLPNLSNKFNFFIFYGLPILLPRFFRKGFLKLVALLRPSWTAYADFLAYLQQAKKFRTQAPARNFYDRSGL